MAVKAFLASLDGVSDALKSEYKQGTDGKYYLDLEGVDDHPAVGALKRAKDREHEGRLEAEKQATAHKTRLSELETEVEQRLKGTLPKENVDALEKSWGKKLTDKDNELAQTRAQFGSVIQKLTVDSEAMKLASGLARTEKEIPLLLPHIAKRLSVEVDTTKAEASIRVLDENGKPTATSLKELREEFIANPTFAAVIVGSKASGGGANGGSQGSGAPGPKVDLTKSDSEVAKQLEARRASRNAG